MKLPPSPWLRASINYEQGLEQSGYYRKRTTKEMGKITIWIIIGAMAILAGVMTGHKNCEDNLTKDVNRREVMSRQQVSAAQQAMNAELFILREARVDSARHLDSLHSGRRQ